MNGPKIVAVRTRQERGTKMLQVRLSSQRELRVSPREVVHPSNVSSVN